ncbi:hypothetical protein NE865_00383 [Phthorimaea operculella]|nr:hypothetical protein NE865_00383 [Phthorimaea operculella]
MSKAGSNGKLFCFSQVLKILFWFSVFAIDKQRFRLKSSKDFDELLLFRVANMDILPITLEGKNLGERHKYLNDLVQKAWEENVPFKAVEHQPEQSAVDRLFKIDLAKKYRQVDYILKTLKDEDMLFVSRALKNVNWLICQPFMRPTSLETKLYPHMLTTASNKLKHWIHLHIKNEFQCQEFYEYYKTKDMDYALKFLPKCPNKFIHAEMKRIPFEKITPHYLKLLSETTEQAALIYFRDLKAVGGVVDEKFIQNIQFLLKTHPKIYFYIIENFYLSVFSRLNKEATRNIMENHRNRFHAKKELYTHRILDLPTLAKYLNSRRAKELIIALARAEYLDSGFMHWFTYKFCEPLTKRINIHEKNEFCNRVFKGQLTKQKLKVPPYPIPPLAVKRKLNDTAESEPSDTKDYDSLLKGPMKVPRLKGGGGPMPTLQELFDKYRFSTFEKTFAELRREIFKEDHFMRREHMFIVLVSKTGGRAESLETLLSWLVERFSNECCMVRAATIRSLVKRAAAWRLPDSTWSLLLQFGHDLGLDGRAPEAHCREGLHCVVLRHILAKKSDCPPEIWAAFLENFSSLNEYALNANERDILHEKLPMLLLNSIHGSPGSAELYLTRLCDALDKYGICVESYPAAITAIIDYVSRNPVAARPLLRRLFESRVACQTFFAQYFKVIQTDASYLNVLRHDAGILHSGIEFRKLLTDNIDALRHESFLRKLAIYFGEKDGLAERYLVMLLQKAEEQPHWKLARPIAHLCRTGYQLPEAPEVLDKSMQQLHRKMVEVLQQNAHLQRPKICPIGSILETKNHVGLAPYIHTCSPKQLQRLLPALLNHGRPARLVLALRAPTDRRLLAQALPHAARVRATRALRITLRILRRFPCDDTLSEDWTALKSIIQNIDLKGKKFEVYLELAKLNDIPKHIRLDYCFTLYEALTKETFGPKSGLSHRIALPLLECILDHWDKTDVILVQNILKSFLKNDFTDDSYGRMGVDYFYWRPECVDYFLKWPNETCFYLDADYYYYVVMHLRYLVRFLLSSESSWVESVRIREYLKPFLCSVKDMWATAGIKEVFNRFLKEFICEETFMNSSNYSETMKTVRLFCDELVPMHTNCRLYFRIRFIEMCQCAMKLIKERKLDVMRKGKVVKKEKFREILALYLGQLAANHLEELVATHFQSIRTFYCDALLNFAKAEFGNMGSFNVIQGLISENPSLKPNAAVVAAMLFNKIRNDTCNAIPSIRKPKDKVFESLKAVPVLEVKFFLTCKFEREECTLLGDQMSSFSVTRSGIRPRKLLPTVTTVAPLARTSPTTSLAPAWR